MKVTELVKLTENAINLFDNYVKKGKISPIERAYNKGSRLKHFAIVLI